jgi:hypothetical protein
MEGEGSRKEPTSANASATAAAGVLGCSCSARTMLDQNLLPQMFAH